MQLLLVLERLSKQERIHSDHDVLLRLIAEKSYIWHQLDIGRPQRFVTKNALIHQEHSQSELFPIFVPLGE